MYAIGGNTAGPGDAVVNVYINHKKKFAFVEMRSVEEATNAMALDGIIFELSPVIKIGMVARDWTHRDKLVTSTTIVKIVRKLMASIEGEELRKRAVELGGSVRSSMAEGGVACKELDSFIANIHR